MSESDRLGPPPVEPLSDLAWSRIERGLWSRMDAAPAAEGRPARAARPQRWLWLAAPVLAAAAAAAAVLTIGGSDGGSGAPTDDQARLVSGAAPTTLSYGDVHLTLDADSAVVMDRRAGALLERGAAWFSVAPRGERAAFVVTAGDTVVRVVGTKFRVARSGEDASVAVEHGTVEVRFRGATTRLGAGEQWTSRRPDEVSAFHVAKRADAPAPATAAPLAEAAAPSPATMPSAELKAPIRADRPVSGPRTSPLPAPLPTPPARAHEPRTEKPNAEKPDAEKPAQIDDDAAKYHRLEQLEVRNPKAAIDGYLELARSSPRWAEPALFAAARLAADRAEPRAQRLIEIYLTRFPSGANVDDARKLLDHMQGANR
ncbi:MAG TPA: FecR family protein [Kofleriaceae bacterium]|nr:FecR family protein [Kofleriaceae bacterium]